MKTQVQVTKALEPELPASLGGRYSGEYFTIADSCGRSPIPAGMDPNFPLCCDPPSEYNERWPVDPAWLWKDYYNKEADDVSWSYANNYGNNNLDKTLNGGDEEDYGKDPYGFIELDGPEGSIDDNFPNSFAVARRSDERRVVRRSLVTTNKTVIDSTFDHTEETIYIYCKHSVDSPECKRLFHGGAVPTIIRLPDDAGEGPFARVAKIELAGSEYRLPQHDLRKRALDRNLNPVYKLTFDYSFGLIERADQKPINMRVDYTNLLPYWDTVTNTPTKRKRSSESPPLKYRDWRSKVDSAKVEHAKLFKRSKAKRSQSVKRSTVMDYGPEVEEETTLNRRWFGAFKAWLAKMNTVESKDGGKLPLGLKRSLLLYRGTLGCDRKAYKAQMKLYLDMNIDMEARYAYYFSGTIFPPRVTDTFAYFGYEPSAYLGLRITGNAYLQWDSGKKKIVDTLTYPGLSIKGIAAVGPALNVYAQLKGMITLSGQIKAGVQATFGRSEIYYPDGAADSVPAEVKDLLPGADGYDLPDSGPQLSPVFEASVQAKAELRLIVTPEVDIGITIGGSKLGTLVSALLSGYVEGTLLMQANASATTTGGGGWEYGYGAYFIYDVGFSASAQIPLYGGWNSGIKHLPGFPGQRTIYEARVKSAPNSPQRRSLVEMEDEAEERTAIKLPRRGLLGGGDEASELKEANGHVVRNIVKGKRAELQNMTPRNASLLTRDLGGFARRADDPMDIDTDNSESPIGPDPQILRCNDGGADDYELPDFRYNCNLFGTVQATSNAGGTATARGVCDTSADFFRALGVPSSGFVLTYSPENERSSTGRYAQSCPPINGQAYCTNQAATFRANLGVQARGPIPITCDEFPFNSAEEGGDWFRTARGVASAAVCAPAYQQQRQSNCNRMFGEIMQTNIGWFDRAADGSIAPNLWKPWNLNWETGGGDWRRTACYPNIIPEPKGVTAWRNDVTDGAGNVICPRNQLGYAFRRNYTFGHAYPQTALDGESWGFPAAEDFEFAGTGSDRPSGTQTDVRNIVCAINIGVNRDIYSYRTNYNAYCLNPIRQGPGGQPGAVQGYFGRQLYTNRCQVDFVGAPFDKRDIGKRQDGHLGYWHKSRVTAIRMLPDHPDDEVTTVDEETAAMFDKQYGKDNWGVQNE